MARAALQKTREAPGSTKARILDAAEAVFAERGFDGASTREIAARAAVNISSLHYHWESKETLYLAVFRDVYDRIGRRLEAVIAPLLAAHRPRGEVIAASIDTLFEFFAARPTLPRLLLRRIVDEDHLHVEVERDALGPSWTASLTLLQSHAMSEVDARFFVLTLHVVQLTYLLDSQAYRTFLGGSVRDEPLRARLREHLVTLTQRLLPA